MSDRGFQRASAVVVVLLVLTLLVALAALFMVVTRTHLPSCEFLYGATGTCVIPSVNP